MTNRIALAVVSTALLLGVCGRTDARASVPTTAPTSQPAAAIDETKAITIAKKAVSENDTWAERAVYKAKRDRDNWLITAWRIEGYDDAGNPRFVTGGHRLIIVDKAGAVTSYIRGR